MALNSVKNAWALMSQNDLDRLFNPFFRIPGQKALGTGLGLAIAKKTGPARQGHHPCGTHRPGDLPDRVSSLILYFL